MFINETRLGCRSPLVLQKLGFDLRSHLDDTLTAPLSDELKSLSDRLLGYAEWRDAAGNEEPHEDEPALF